MPFPLTVFLLPELELSSRSFLSVGASPLSLELARCLGGKPRSQDSAVEDAVRSVLPPPALGVAMVAGVAGAPGIGVPGLLVLRGEMKSSHSEPCV